MNAAGVYGFTAPPWGAWSWWNGQLAFAVFFVFIYTKGMSGAKGEGLRYGLFLGLLWYLPGLFMDWPSAGFGASLWHTLAGILGFIIFGIAACLIYKSPKTA